MFDGLQIVLLLVVLVRLAWELEITGKGDFHNQIFFFLDLSCNKCNEKPSSIIRFIWSLL